MTPRARRLILILTLALPLLIAGAGEALAQRGGDAGLRPPVPERPDNPPRWLHYGVIAILGAATIAIAILPSKRGHQD
jgi:hypothetical protein